MSCDGRSGGQLTIGISDPHRTASTITVQLVYGGSLVSADSGITVTQTSPTLTLTVDLSGAAGATHEATFTATSATLTPTADTYVRDGSYATTVYGTATTLVVKNASTSGYNRQAFLTYDTSSVLGTIGSATLSAHGYVSDSGGTTATLTAYGVSDTTWTESALTRHTKPALGTALSTAGATTTKSWLAFDVTSHVDATGEPVCLALAEGSAGLAVILDSRENTANPPVLRLVLADG
ncbi:DNRLRE domain-containing protein [Streptomyces sp. NPDC006510]|uniref:CBM96 family carbohydrate-binding protein n=1 Tax=Streptomyces sp. NPDC006510 TaxID=3155600 RepID=UPI0033A16C06